MRLSSIVDIKKLVILYLFCYMFKITIMSYFIADLFFTYFIRAGILNLTNFKVYDIRKIF